MVSKVIKQQLSALLVLGEVLRVHPHPSVQRLVAARDDCRAGQLGFADQIPLLFQSRDVIELHKNVTVLGHVLVLAASCGHRIDADKDAALLLVRVQVATEIAQLRNPPLTCQRRAFAFGTTAIVVLQGRHDDAHVLVLLERFLQQPDSTVLKRLWQLAFLERVVALGCGLVGDRLAIAQTVFALPTRLRFCGLAGFTTKHAGNGLGELDHA